jgi:hypothetical protein
MLICVCVLWGGLLSFNNGEKMLGRSIQGVYMWSSSLICSLLSAEAFSITKVSFSFVPLSICLGLGSH